MASSQVSTHSLCRDARSPISSPRPRPRICHREPQARRCAAVQACAVFITGTRRPLTQASRCQCQPEWHDHSRCDWHHLERPIQSRCRTRRRACPRLSAWSSKAQPKSSRRGRGLPCGRADPPDSFTRSRMEYLRNLIVGDPICGACLSNEIYYADHVRFDSSDVLNQNYNAVVRRVLKTKIADSPKKFQLADSTPNFTESI
jgi:hypothetical protein